jgi:chromosome segregation ATPase
MPPSLEIRLVACCAGLLIGAVPALAQTARSGAGGSDPRLVQQLQQLGQERTALLTENARIKKELDRSQADLKSATNERDGLKARLGAAEAGVGRAKSSAEADERALAQSKAKLDELIGRFREMAQSMKAVETDRAQAQQLAADRGRALDACATANVELYGIANDTLTRYEASGRHKEPFIRIARNRIENAVDESRQRVEELRVRQAPPPPPTAPSPQGR